jgi:hypothetical protein
MKKIALTVAVALVGLSSAPAFATDYRYYGGYYSYGRYDPEIRRDRAEIRRDEAELRRDLWAYRHGANNGREIERDRRELWRDRMELRRDLDRRRW